MRIGILSDTHDNINAAKKAAEIFKREKIDTLFHLGDFIAPFTLKIFKDFTLYGVFGNNDGEKLLLMNVAEEYGFHLYESPFELNINSKNFLIVHGWGSPERTKSLVNSFAKSGKYEFVLYGHTHQKDLKKLENTTIINPGETCGYLSGEKSIAILDLDEGKVHFILLE